MKPFLAASQCVKTQDTIQGVGAPTVSLHWHRLVQLVMRYLQLCLQHGNWNPLLGMGMGWEAVGNWTGSWLAAVQTDACYRHNMQWKIKCQQSVWFMIGRLVIIGFGKVPQETSSHSAQDSSLSFPVELDWLMWYYSVITSDYYKPVHNVI